jgi:hypothetical protein
MKKEQKPVERYERFFEMANLVRSDTGLDYKIWISPQSGKEKHWARIKVEIDNHLIPVSISQDPKILLKRKVTISNFDKLRKFIILNYDVLMDYWNSRGEMSLRDVFKRLKKVKG